MNPNSHAIQRLCRVIRIGSIVFIAGVVAIYLLTWCWPPQHHDGPSFTPHFLMMMRLAGLPATAMSSLSLGDRLLIGSISLPYLAALVWAFYRLGKMLRGFERGEFFEQATVAHLRAFAGFLLLAKILSLAALHLRVAAMVHVLGHDKFRVMINLSSDDLAVLLMCALFFLIAHMMEEGQRLAEENREFI